MLVVPKFSYITWPFSWVLMQIVALEVITSECRVVQRIKMLNLGLHRLHWLSVMSCKLVHKCTSVVIRINLC